ncbi:hypothetical protein [Amycolatopsis sp. Poz14]|uniref:hypothetical protein n=1 Tax=Amycolatopsis sp. Poz14 TaxID=1447705 RepID=UPI001EE95D1F|nr:hypothetical protein [Amycolatopsis sp. Poz14]MCG3756690.1 hypothetical protein [Amycolatopsis sp. Poz14]
MAAKDAESRRRNGRLAIAKRWGNTEEVERLTLEHREAKLQEHITEMVSTWPPLTNEQRVRLAALLVPSNGGAA